MSQFVVCLRLVLILHMLLSVWEVQAAGRQNSSHRLLPGYCRPTVYMIMKGQRRAIPVGKVVKPNLCVDCTCKESGDFECCLSKTNAGKTFVFRGPLCTKCTCAELPYSKNIFPPDSVVGNHCFRGNSLMTCETSLCIHPLAADPNCIETSVNENECCDRCVRSGCYIMINGTTMEAQNNQLAINNFEKEGVDMIKMDFGESIQTGCLRGSCLAPDFMFEGGFVVQDFPCVNG